jgi:hypothetical protein
MIMSATQFTLTFTATVADSDQWPAEYKELAREDDAPSYGDWIMDRLRKSMETAGDQFIARHSALFAVKEVT